MAGSKGQSSSVGNGYCTMRNNKNDKTNAKQTQNIKWNLLYKAHRNSTVATPSVHE
jgi:hypothetical protein